MLVGDGRLRLTVASHRFYEEIQDRILITGFTNDAFEQPASVVHLAVGLP